MLLLQLLRLRGCVVAQVPFQRQLGLVEPVLEGGPVPVCVFWFCVTIVRVCVKERGVCKKRSPMNRPCDQEAQQVHVIHEKVYVAFLRGVLVP